LFPLPQAARLEELRNAAAEAAAAAAEEAAAAAEGEEGGEGGEPPAPFDPESVKLDEEMVDVEAEVGGGGCVMVSECMMASI
jgi:hypothetical protein